MDDDGIGKQVRGIFEIHSNNSASKITKYRSRVPVKHYSTSEVSKGNMVCKNCERKPRNHCVKFVKSFPCIFFTVLERCQYDFLQKKILFSKDKG